MARDGHCRSSGVCEFAHCATLAASCLKIGSCYRALEALGGIDHGRSANAGAIERLARFVEAQVRR